MNPFWTKLTINASITFGILIMVALIIFRVGVDIENNSNAIFKLNQEVNSGSAALSEIVRLKTVAAEIPPFLDKLKRALPDEDALIGLESELSLTARHNDLGYTFKWGTSSNVSAGLKSIIFDMTLQGSYQNIMKFLGAIETNGRFIGITNIDISQQADKYMATINGLIYHSDAEKVQ